jgi:hypothetical protein
MGICPSRKRKTHMQKIYVLNMHAFLSWGTGNCLASNLWAHVMGNIGDIMGIQRTMGTIKQV